MADREEILEALRTIDSVGLPRDFDTLVNEGAGGGESHSITGDDLASLCLAFKTLFDHFGYDYTQKWSYIQDQPNLKGYDTDFHVSLRMLDEAIARQEEDTKGVDGI